MKKASELGLSVRVVKDKVFLLKGGSIDLNGEGIAFDINDLIACSEQMGSFPLLVIEDEVEKMADSDTEGYFETDYQKIFVEGFIRGYNKAKETFKFTEEDLRKAIQIARHTLEYDERWGWYETKTEQEIIQSLTKKELWIEVEFKETKSAVFRENDAAPYGIYEPKITNNKIKALWK